MKFARILLLSGWIGVCALAMLEQTRLLFGLPPVSAWLLVFVFCGAVFGYNFTYPERWRRGLAWGLGLAGAVCFWHIPVFARWVTLVPVAVWALYYGFRRPGNAGLRARPVVKPLAIALAWAWVTVLLPLEARHWAAAAVLVAGRAAFVFALALAYDLADLEFDRRHGLPTLAGRLGERKTLQVADAALLFSACCIAANYFLKNYSLAATLALLASLTLTACGLRIALRKLRPPVAQKLLIDGLMVVQFALVWATIYCQLTAR